MPMMRLEERRKLAMERKATLLKVAAAGGARPDPKSEHGKWLAAYAYPSSNTFDSMFRHKLEKYWFSKESKRQRYLDSLPHDKPRYDSKEGKILAERLRDPVTRRLVYEMRPHWLRYGEISKDHLVEIARTGRDKPRSGTKTWEVFNAYLNPDSNEFDKDLFFMVLSLRPEWFNFKRLKSNMEKAQ